MIQLERAGWVGFAVGLLVGFALCVAIATHPVKASQPEQECQQEDEIKVPVDFPDYWECTTADDWVGRFIRHHYNNGDVGSAVERTVCGHGKYWYRHHGVSIMPEACDGY